MSEDGGATPPPYVLDVSVLAAVARFDTAVMALIQGYDSRGQPLVVPGLALTGASLDVRSEDADDLLEGVERLGNVEVAPLRDAEQALGSQRLCPGPALIRGMPTWPPWPTRRSARF